MTRGTTIHDFAPFPPFTITMPVVIRQCTRADLAALEWFGLFTEHREIIEATFAGQEHGKQVMLIAEGNGAPLGQVWIDLVKKRHLDTGYLWAMRVFPWLCRLGVGMRLITAAEHLLRQHGFARAELGVDKHNQRAERLYQRFGYERIGEFQEEYGYTRPDGAFMRIVIDEWIYWKELGRRGPVEPDENHLCE